MTTMIRYRDNPHLKIKVVTTVRGNREYRRNCRKIKDKYYVINEDCFEVQERWYTAKSKLITLDHEKGVYVLVKDTPLVYGIVAIKEDGTATFGNFTENKYNNVLISVPNYGVVNAINEKVLIEGNYMENISDGVWHYKKGLTASELKRFKTIESKRVYTNKGYNIEDNAIEFVQKTEAYDKYPIKVTSSAVKYAKLLGDTSHGHEIETASGYLPEHIQNRTGVVICRDGSIQNAEYVTIPLRGAKGLANIKYLASELAKRTTTDNACAYHIHLGTLPKTRLFILALYALGIRIQDEVFTMFPYYKTEWKGIKRQSYNAKLRKLGIEPLKAGGTKEEFTKYVDEGYYRIFTFLNDGISPDNRHNRTTHVHNQHHKWQRKQRYYWMNFMNMFFSNRETIEFRLHQNTVNGQKMINWLFMCNAIVHYAERHAAEILSSDKPISFENVLSYYEDVFKTETAQFLSRYLIAYFRDRKAYFQADFKRDDYLSEKETKDDPTYTFEFKGVGELF
jgi:hypothetical protein